MPLIKAELHWREGVLAVVQIQGHAAQSELCTAVSCLLRSTAEAIQGLSTLDWDLKIPTEGEFFWELRSWHKGQADILCGISQVLCCGLRHLSKDFPQDLNLCEVEN